MDFRLLGRLEVEDRGELLRIPGSKPQALLAVLLLNRNQLVSFPRLIGALWPGEQPPSARQSLQFYVHQLRKVLEPDPADHRVLRTDKGNYRLHVEPGQFDVDRFQDAVVDARRSRSAGDLDAAWAMFGQGLALWRGAALAEFADDDFAQGETARLEELRLTATVEQLQTGLELGRHAELIGELDALIRSHPLREQLRMLQMLALYRSGRQVEALAAYGATHDEFADQLGIEPGPELQRLRQQIADSDPALGAPPRPAPDSVVTTAHSISGHDEARELREPAADPHAASAAPTTAAPAGPAAPPTDASTAAAMPRDQGSREERKVVTILVAGTSPVTESEPVDPEDVRGTQDATFGLVRAQVQRYGGVVQALVADRVLAVFGVPRSSEDDPERAVRAALEVCAGASEAGQAVRVGVATGEVVVTLPGDEEDTRGISVVGDVVHAAAALEALAPPGGVVAGAGTYRATRRVIRYQPLRRASALEQATGSAVWQALAPRGRTGALVTDQRVSPLVERTRELQILTDLLGRFLREREPFMLSLVADPGMGKTRLVAELGQLADNAPELVTWRRGRSLPHDEGTFWALTEIVKSHAGILDNDPASVATEKLEQAVAGAVDDDDEAGWVARQLQMLLAADPSAPTQGEHKDEVFAGWARFLQAAATHRPLVMVLEDLQWADEALLEFADNLVELVPAVPLLVVATGRPELLERRPGWGGGKRNAATMTLAPLSRSGTEELLDALLGGTALPEETRAAMLTSSGGNPLYVEEYVRMLHDLPTQDTGGSLPIPESVQQLIAARIDTLPPEDKALLQDAAVVGEVGWLGALRSLGDRAAGEAREGLQRLERRGLLRRVRTSSVAEETEYTFRHALVRDVAYAGVLRDDRLGKHRQVATWVESLNPERVGDRVELLAHHYTQALDLARAGGQPDPELTARSRSVLRAAGDRSLAMGAYASAERSYSAALELLPERAAGSDRAETLHGLAQAVVYGRHTGEDLMLQARDALDAAGNITRAMEAEVSLCNLAMIRGDAAQAEVYLDAALARDTGPTRMKAVAIATRAVDLMLFDEHRACLRLSAEARRMAEEIGTPEVLDEIRAITLVGVGGSKLKHGDASGADDLNEALELLERMRHTNVHLGRFDVVWGWWWFGDLARCAAEIPPAREKALKAHAVIAHWFDATQAGIDAAVGRWDEVVALADQSIARGMHGPDGYIEPWYRVLRGRIRFARGDHAGALEDADAGLEVAARGHDTRHRHAALALRGRVLLAAGSRDEAEKLLEGLLGEQRDRPEQSCATPDLGALVVDLDFPADSLPDGLSPTRWHDAVRALTERDFDRAARGFATIGSPAAEALTRLRAAHAHAAAGRTGAARADLEQVIAFNGMAGGTADLAEAEALLGKLDG